MIMRRACGINEEINSLVHTLTEGIAAPSVFSPQLANPCKRHWIEGSICRGDAKAPACGSSADVRHMALVRRHGHETSVFPCAFYWLEYLAIVRSCLFLGPSVILYPASQTGHPQARSILQLCLAQAGIFVLIDFSCQHAKFKRCHIKFQISDFS